MLNHRFNYLLSQAKGMDGKRLWTVARVAEEIGSGRAHVVQVLANKPGRGGHTRKRLIRFFRGNFTYWRDMLAALGWTEEGGIVPQGMFHGLQPEPERQTNL